MAMPKTKKKAPRAAPRLKRGGKLAEPKWDDLEKMTGAKIHAYRRFVHSWYYENFKPAELYSFVAEWMLKEEYSKEDIKAVKAAPNSALSITAAIVARMDMMGAPRLSKPEADHWLSLPGTMGELKCSIDFLKESVEKYIEAGKDKVAEKEEEEKEKVNVYVPSIQERIRDQAVEQSEDIDIWLEGWIEDPNSFDPKGFDFKRHFGSKGVTQAHARKLKSFYEDTLADYDDLERMPTKGQLAKMSEHDADMWEQLKEGYAHVKKADIKKLRTAISELMVALDFIIDQAKATRKPRKAKPRSADKVIAKLKFLKVDEKYKLASINPIDVIGANELWVFNVKTRKLGKYIASSIDPKGLGREGTGLSVKGTTIISFDEKLSVQKTLRKPDEQLKEFKGAGKVALRKFLDEINTTDTKLNGRCNLDTVLLKVS
jgi:hypothetical protein